jgi:hypothetical protein
VNVATHKYPDTALGALQYLGDETQGALDLDAATVDPDSYVKGVWQVHTPSDPEVASAIVYLAGYEDSMGRVRERNDFECFYELREDT